MPESLHHPPQFSLRGVQILWPGLLALDFKQMAVLKVVGVLAHV
jgi:hypothetical protein